LNILELQRSPKVFGKPEARSVGEQAT